MGGFHWVEEWEGKGKRGLGCVFVLIIVFLWFTDEPFLMRL